MFLDLCTSCLQRDFDTQIGLHVIEIATILAKYGKLNKDLTSKIFSIEFLDKLDNEIENQCPSNAERQLGRTSTYPRRLRRAMMNLNRVVCVCYPEYNVPWFHEKYCMEEANNLRGPSFYESQLDHLRDDIYQTICLVVGGSKNVRENVFSPYYHFVDFEVWMDKSEIVDAPTGIYSNTCNFLPIGKFLLMHITMN